MDVVNFYSANARPNAELFSLELFRLALNSSGGTA
jgi:hypothetical protein